ncbi:Ig-like domain-containing protein [Escherichia fergusonii]|uniref:Ig-like domain-containing protein n=2 Tax=Escherichia fergusonii TaxID=564 RepID=UPI0015E4A9C8|nr:Ig-like domain-containing protein [Escherichia fergusonii]MBA8579876.1 Ig-like domain-containing protein [Escherichia fergusonii]QLM34024.1 Ig-like domain-containing protein [Escherichia fergusonii]
MSLIIDVISRKTSVKQTLINPGDVTVVIYEPSVVQVHAQASAVARYVRDGNDLLIYMQDGTVIRCNGYFLQAANTSEQSELVFADGQQLTHVTFADTAAGGLAPVELTAQTTAIESIAPYLDTVAQTSTFPWGWLAGAAVGGGALGALLASGGDDDSKTEVVNNPPPAEPGNATPSFLVTDNQGDQRGILSANDITDDTTPTFSGSGQAGATIQIKDSNGDTIASTQVGSDGRWSVDLPTQSAGEHTWSVVQIVGSTITNAGSITLTIDNSQAAVQLATTAGDNIINASEQAAGFTLSGTSSHLAQGTELTVTLNGKTYTTSVGANGAWSVQVPTADAQTLGEGNQAVLVSGKDATGNTVTGAQLLTVDTQPPTLAINTIAQDNIVSASEHNASLVVSGTSNAEAGQTVTLTVNGKSHTATVGSDGTWQVTLPAAEVQALADGDYTINASVSDRAGNTTSNSVNFTVDTGAPVVSVNTVAGDDILNTAEQIVAQIISGRVSGASPGDTVTVKLGATVLSGVVQADGSWNVALDPAVTRTLARGPNDIIVTVTDAAGNTGTATHNITLAGVAPQVAIDAISGDNVLNALESQQPLTLSGTSNLPDGGTVSVTLNNVTYSAQVSGGVWSLSVPVSDVVNLANTNYTVTASATDVTGNTGTAQSNLLVDTVLPQVIINTFAGDNIVNNAEAGADQTLSGVVVGAAQGDTVTIELGGNTYTATVGSNLTWSVNVPAADLQALGDGALTINASVTNVHGNTGSSALDITISAGLPGLRIDTIAGDDVINAVEQQQNLIITGSSTNLPAGRVVTVLLGGNTYQGVTDSNGNWQVGVPAADLQALTPGTIVVNASATDPAGNPVTIDRNVEVNPGAVLITINTVSGDDIINAAEKGAPLTLTGTTQLVETGQTVVVKFAGQTFTTTVQAGGGWSLTVPASAVSSLADGATEITATVTNISGNTGDTSRTITVDSQAPALSIDSLTADNIINAAESGQDLQITGTTDAQPGQTVTVTLNGQTYQGVVQPDGTWSVTVPAANVDALADGNATVTASVNDIAGNPTSVSRVALVDATPPVVTINPVATDNVINTPEHTQAQIISGTVTGAQAGDIVTVTLNNVNYTTVVDASGNWSLGVPSSVVSGLADGSYPISASVTDRAGNTGSQSLTVMVDTAAPVIGINTIAGDDVINASEKGADVQITGTSDQPVNTAITVTLNGQNYTTTTDASGNWSVTVPASAVTALGQANYTVTAAVTSNIGNSNTASHNVLVDSALPGVTINPVATDDIINAAEAGAAQTISGQVTGAAVGDTVTVTLGGNTYTATVQANLSWSVSVPAADIQALGNGDLTVSASVTNQNGNTGSGTRDITIDANLPGLRVDTVAGDDVVNIIEHGQALVVTGSSSGLAEGTPLTVTINNVEYTTAVQADGGWSVGVTAAQVSAWPAGTVTVTVSGESSAGNPISITHPVTVDLTPAAITINTIATDDVINAAEKGADLTLSGTTTNVEPGQTVTVTFGGKNYTANVASDGSWTATVPAADLAALPEGSTSAQASVSNINGNSASAVHNYSVDSSAPTIIINTVASDNIVNASEADTGVTVSGSTTAEAGQIVTVTLNSPTVQTYQATVQADGSWSITIPAADLAALTDGSHTLTATVNDKAGNPASTTHNLAVDLTVPVLTINTIAGDDIINAAEHGQALVISGSSTGGEAGDVVTVTLNSKTYTTTLDASGNWSVGVPAADVSALGSGPQTVTATVTDVAGNSDNETHTVTVNLTAPTIGINPIASDDVINATEKGADLQISGTSNQPTGTTITVTLNGQNYSATTDAAGNWSTTVPASAVGALGEASYTVTANVTDSAGNSNSASHNVEVNTALPGVTINPVATDDIINAAESGVAQTISGQVTGAAAGDTVTVTLGGKTYTATVQGNFSWSVDVPAADIQAIGNGELTVNASVTNGVGNTGSGARDIVIDANLPGLRVDTVAGDDVVNSIEHGQALVITGSSSGLAAGAALTVVVNTVTYAATVLADGTWSLGVPAADVGNWPAGTVDITVSGTNTAGTTTTITHPVTVDLAAVAISINTVSGDDVINAAEKGADLTLSGSTSGVEAGQTVTVTFGGKTYTATVAGDGSWTTTVPAADLSALRDGDATVQASVSNINGNTASATHAYSVDATAPTLAINTIATDDILNAAEAGNPLTISGTSTAEAGQTVTVTLNGVAYIGTVQAGGSWSVSVPTTDLSNLTASPYTVSASVSDKAGNPATATHGLAVDLTVPVLTINTVSGDDIINAAEHGQALVISGSSTGGEAGDVITITLNSKTYTTTLDASGNWSVGVPAADVTALGSGPQTITAAITDVAGNSDDASRTVTVNLTAPTIGINTIASDDVINATEKGADLQITGTSNQPAGTTITVTLNGQNYTATTDSSGNWSATVPASAVSSLGEANYTVTANVTDSAGNSNSASHNVLVNSALPGVTINAVATDDIINAAEAGSAQTISGQVTGAAAGDTVTVTLGGNTYTATVQANLSWSVDVPAADIQALGNGDLTVNASVTNIVGNSGSGSRDITIDANLPGLRVDTVAGDDVINSIEHNQALVITGSSTGLTAGTALTVVINNVTYAATVLADGTWNLGVPAADVSNWPAGTVDITVSGTNSAGTTSTITHPVTVDLAAVAITINTLSGDDVINAVEKGETLVVSGSTSGVETGQTVTVTFGGKNYTTTVEANGSWTVNVPPADLAALPDGAGNVQASVSNINGNSAQADRAYSVDATAPLVTINTIVSDDILNVSEAGAGITISGTTTAQAGQTLTVTLNNNTYQTTVQADGTWSVNVPATDLSGLTASSYTVTATVSDKAGNPASADHALAVDVTAPDLTINTVAGDDIINAIEHGQALVVSGTSTGAAAGDVVTVTLNGKNYTTTLDASGNWSVGIPAADVTALATGSQTITASLSDRAGNSDSTTHDVTVDLSGPTLTINTVSGDDIINNAEKTQDLIISGVSSGLAAGTTVTVMLNGLAYSATTDGSGNWSVTVPASAVGALGEAIYSISASATDSAGNSGSTTHTVNVDSLLPGVIINTVAGDDIINAAEIAVNQTLSGLVTGTAVAGNTVIVTIGGNQYTATVQPDLSWSVSVPAADLQALGNGELTISASVTNSANNTGTATHDIVIDANLPGLRVDTVAGDDVINSIEHTQALVVTGSSTGLAAGAALTVVINSVTYGATVLADGTWSVGVPSADVTNWPAGTVNIAVSGTNTAGTTTSITHPVTVNLAAVAITINTLSTDDVINAAEKGTDLQLSGTTSGVEAGQTITVIFGGKSYTTTVAADNTWGLTIPAADLATLPDGAANVQASVSNVAGNNAQATHVYSVDATAPSVTINTIASDDILNAAEAGSALTISGTSTAEAGQTVTVTLNGVNYSGNVQADGSWSVSVPTGDLADLTASPYTVSAAVSDKAGNPTSATHNLTVDLAAPVVTINTVAGDDIINATEHAQAQIISGSATGATTGNTVSVTIGTTTYTTVLDANGNWSIGVPASVISALAQGDVTITATVTDSAGNSGTASHTVSVALGAPILAINTIAVDDIINATEKGADLSISGTSNQPAGTQVTVTLNGQNYTTTADASGNWSVTVPASAVGTLGEATYTVTAAATDVDGNSGSASHNVQVNTALPGVTINVVATDDIINAAEAGATQTISGQVTRAAAGDTVTVTLGGATYTATVQADLSWSVDVPASALQALGNGELTISASVTNSVGNTGNGTREITIDANLPGLRVDTVAGDDVVNIIEHGQALVITGSSSGLAVGSNVTLTINGQTYVAAVLADGTWSVGVPAVDVSAWPAGAVTITASGSTTAGNPVSVTHPVTVDLSAVAVSINAITADDVINAAEKGAALTLSGSTSGVEAGQTVTVTFGGKTYTASVAANGSWSTTVPAADMAALRDGDASAQASVSNVNGNSATTTHAYSVDATAPTVTINTIAGDDILNAAEAGAALTITGSSTAEAGQTVTVTLNGANYTGTVQTDGSWSISVPPADLSALTASNYTVSAAVSDKAGNPTSVNHNLTVDTSVPVVTINTVAGDDVINAAEHAQAQIISGSATGAATGNTVTVTIGTNTFTTVLDASGNWSVGVPASVVSALANGTVTINASVTDAAGNSGNASHQVTVNTGLPTITFNAISSDNVLNADEKGQPLTISGSSTGLATGAQVTVTLNGHNYSATTDAAGNWTLTVPVSDLAALGQANYTVSASATSAAGNTASSQANLLVDSGLPGVTINTVAGDDIINAAEAGAAQTISGVVTRAAAGDTVTVTLGGNTYTTTVQGNLSWSISVPAADLQALGNGDLTITASVTNANGNTGSGTRDITIDANLPGLRVDTVAGDDIVNSIEHGQALVITGGSSGLNAGAVLTVTINSVAYSASVQADGSWSVGIPAASVSAWPAGPLTVDVTGQSSAGNPVSVSHPFTVDLTAVAISINTVASDDVINAAEKGTDLTLSGSTSGIESGQTVTVTFGGKTYTASGNNASATHAYSVDASAPTLTINIIASDDILNATEAGNPLTISGTSTAETGQTVTVTLNGATYTGNVQEDGSWSVSVPTSALVALTASNYTVSATVNDKAGNPGSASHNLAIDTTAPVLTINTVAGDDILNDAEHAQALVISGTSTGGEAGDVVSVVLNGKTYTTTLDASGNWSVGVPAADVAALSSGAQTITASVSDRAGNSDDASRTVTVNLTAPAISINTIAGDDVINATEKGSNLALSGTSDQPAGTAISVTLNGQNYSATTDASGNWSVTVPASAVSALGEATYSVTASVTNAQGNSSTASHNVQVSTALPGVTINPVATDDIINAAEAGSAQTISGQVTGAAAGSTVTVTLGGKTYTATVQADLSWNVSIPAADWQALGNGELTVNASVTNAVGNTGSGMRDITIDASLPGLRVDTVAGDDVVNIIEHGQAQVITGSSSGFTAGTALTVVINNQTYAATVLANGSWSVGVPAADVSNWPAGTLNITVSGANSAGTQTSITHPVSVDLTTVAISINAITPDDVINAAEKGAALTLSGSTSGVEAGQTVTITFGGKTYTTTVAANGSWSTTVPTADLAALRDGDASAQVRVTNVNGNSATTTHEYSVDSAAPTVTINTIASDNIINASEAAAGVTVSGTSTAETGQTLTVTLNGTNYQTTVQADGSWSLMLPASDLTALANNGYTLTATVSDLAGNPGSASKGVTVDTTAPVISFNTVAGDDVINNVEHSQAQIISGTATGAVAGDRLVVTIAGQQYVTSTDASGNWSVGVPASVVSGLADGTVTISATITDSAGNSSTQTHNVQVNTAVVSLSVSTISGDNIINTAEAGSALTLSGTGTNFATGTVVTVLLNGKGYSATIQNNGSWSVNVSAADVAALADGTSYTVSASAQDSAGNSATASRSVAVDLTAPVISINTVSTDDRLNAAEQQQPLTLNGSTSAEVGQTVTVTFGGKTYTATVAANGTWALNVPAADLAALGQGAQTITASVNDRAGNPGQTTHALTVDTVAPTVTIATVAGDDIINNAEQLAGQTISGTTTAEAGQTVSVTFNGQNWTATVGSGGSWSVFIPAQQFAGLSDGSYTISATVSDQAGNPGSASRGVTLNGDVPTVTINTFAGDDVVNAAEHGTSLVISGTTTAPVGQTLTLTLNGKTYTTTVQSGGSWSYTLGSADVTALADGNAYVINASVSNTIGNTGSSNHTITVDLSAPAMGINIDSLQADTGLSASDFITSVSPVVVNGSLTAALASNETAQISIDGGVTWTTLTVTGTTWRYNDSRTLTDGNYLYQVRVIDAAGNVGATDSQNVVIDTTAPDPAVKTIAISAITTDTGLITNDFVTSDTTLAVSGTLGAALSAGEFAQISIDGGTTWQNLAVNGLTWTYLDGRTLTDGNYNYQVRVIDTAGNIGATASQIVTVDTTAPLASKTIVIAGISDDTGLSSSDFVTRDTTLTVRGTLGAALAADERAQISLDGGVTWTTLTVIGTSWSYADGRTLTDGTWNYTVRVVDLAGNVGQTATQNVVVDTISPEAAKSITITGISDDTGASSSDFITSDTMLTVRGVLGVALGANEFAQISTDNGATWVNVTVAADGLNWTYVDGRTLTNGTTTWQVRVVDLAGNVGATGSQSAQIDTVNPAQVLTIASISTDTGSSTTDFITSDTTLTLTGSLGAGLASGEVAQISLDGGATWTTLTTNGTQWTYTDSRTLTDGSYVYQVRVLDLAGNTGPVVSKTVVVDTINPTATPTIVSYTDDVGQRQGTFSNSQATDDTTPLLNGVLSAPLASGEVVYLYRNGLLLGAVTMVGALNWTYSDSGLVSGAYTYSTRVVDLAGNITSSSDFVLTVDTSIPTTLAQITNQTTRDTTPIISGVITAALASGQYVEVVINGKTYTSQPGGAVVVDPAHNTWYVQLPDTDALAASATAYNVTAQVKSSAGNGNTANVSNGTVTVNAAIDYTPAWTTTSKSTAWGLTYGLDNHGMWTVLANQQIMQSTDPLTWSKTALTLVQSGNNYATSSIADYNRNGTGDLFITRDDYGTGYINGFTNNGDGTFSSAIQVNVGTLTWYGSIVAFDKEGDGYLDFWIGDAGGPDSNTFLWNNAGTLTGNSTTANNGGSATVGGAVTGYLSLNEGSGVDLNNDGRIDLVQHTFNLNNNFTLSSLISQGNGTFVWGQNTVNTFLSSPGSGGNSTSVSMTWADFDGDGDMDLFLPASQGRANYGSLLFNTNGVLGSPVAVGATATTYASQFSLAVDWDHDGLMDIARIAQTGQSYLYTNVSNASNWTQSALGGSQSGTTSGVAAMDYDWDGAVDVLVTKQSGSVFLIRNTNTVSYGTSLHLRITDPNGINVYYGNTVKLYNSAGVLVATQIINPQSGMGVNDTSALVNFYGLNAGETYNAVLIKSTGTTASNIDQTVNTTWGGLQATDATHAYDLSAEVGTASNNGKFVGTGYNDTFFATAGTDTYDGSGGWVYSSGTGTWLANGGMDVVDFRLSTVGVTANLSVTTAQATGFNTSTFTNIEGISGSNFNDTLTGSSGDNQLEGRGGNDTINIGNGGHDTLLYKLLSASDATGGNGSDVVNGFTVGTWEGTADTDRIDIRELLQGSGYTGNGKASYVNGVATLDAQAGNIGDFVKVTQSGSDTIVQIDRDGTGGNFATANVVTLTGVHTDLATLLANHQLMVV